MMKGMSFKKMAVAVGLVAAIAYQGEGNAVEKVSTKMDTASKFGANVGIGDPFPGLVGLNLGYNITEDIRVTAGYAEVEVTTGLTFSSAGITEQKVKAETFAAGGQYLFTNWAFRPTLGLHAGYFSVSGEGEFEVNGFSKDGGYLYSNAGFDWISDSGLHVATGMNLAFSGGSGFYANLGYFF